MSENESIQKRIIEQAGPFYKQHFHISMPLGIEFQDVFGCHLPPNDPEVSQVAVCFPRDQLISSEGTFEVPEWYKDIGELLAARYRGKFEIAAHVSLGFADCEIRYDGFAFTLDWSGCDTIVERAVLALKAFVSAVLAGKEVDSEMTIYNARVNAALVTANEIHCKAEEKKKSGEMHDAGRDTATEPVADSG